MLVGAFFVLASPYIAFLYEHTGHFRMEGKWNINYTIAQRMLMGMTFNEAAFGIDRDLRAEGPLLVPSEFADYTPFPHALPDKVRSMLLMANDHKETVYGGFWSPSVGSPALLALVVLGLFRTSWSDRRIVPGSSAVGHGSVHRLLDADGNCNRVPVLFPVSAAAAAVGRQRAWTNSGSGPVAWRRQTAD